jgi:ABC-type phosphate transport system permease subunit
MSSDYSAANAAMVAVLIGLPVMVVGLFGLTWWERQRERRMARAGSRRQRRRSGG